MESADGGQQDATRPQDIFRGRTQGVAPLTAKRDWHSLRRRAQRHRTPRQQVLTTRDSGRHREPGDSHGQRLRRHFPTHSHGGTAHCRACHHEHQARRFLANSTSHPGRKRKTKPGTRRRSQRRRRSRRHRTNPWSTNRRKCDHQDQQTRPGAAYTLLLDMRLRMQAQ